MACPFSCMSTNFFVPKPFIFNIDTFVNLFLYNFASGIIFKNFLSYIEVITVFFIYCLLLHNKLPAKPIWLKETINIYYFFSFLGAGCLCGYDFGLL